MLTIEIPPFELDVNQITLIALNNIAPDLKVGDQKDVVPVLYSDVTSSDDYQNEESCKEYLSKLLKEYGETEYSENIVKCYLKGKYALTDSDYDELYVLVHSYFKSLDYGKT